MLRRIHLPTINILYYVVALLCSMFVYQVSADPCDKVVFEYPLDQLMKEIGGQ